MSDTLLEQESHDHPTPATYVKIAVILTLITAVEVAVYYVPAMRGILVPLLLVLSAVKFLTVVGWYMHLKMDPVIYSRLFFAPLVVAMAMTVVLMLLFGHFVSHAKP